MKFISSGGRCRNDRTRSESWIERLSDNNSGTRVLPARWPSEQRTRQTNHLPWHPRCPACSPSVVPSEALICPAERLWPSLLPSVGNMNKNHYVAARLGTASSSSSSESASEHIIIKPQKHQDYWSNQVRWGLLWGEELKAVTLWLLFNTM